MIEFAELAQQLSQESQQLLMDYFNLCAEEYLYFRSGYIDEDVWRSWTRGMRIYAQVPVIREIWERDLSTRSLHGACRHPVDADGGRQPGPGHKGQAPHAAAVTFP